MIVPTIKNDDWTSVRQAIHKLAKHIDPLSTPVFSGLTLTGKSGVLWSNAGIITSDAALNYLTNPDADKTFNCGDNSISFNFINPSNQPTYDGAFEIQASGAFTGDLLHIHQHTGNPGTTDLVHLEATDSDVTLLRLYPAGSGISLEIGDHSAGVFRIDDTGKIEWGTGGSYDVNLYRDGTNSLATDDNFSCYFLTASVLQADYINDISDSPAGKMAVDLTNRTLQDSTGSNIMIDFSTDGTVDFSDNDITTTGDVTGNNLNITNWDAAYTATSDYLNQAVKTTSSPYFSKLGLGSSAGTPDTSLHISNSSNTNTVYLDNTAAGAVNNYSTIISRFKDSGGTLRDGPYILFLQESAEASSVTGGFILRGAPATRILYLNHSGYTGICPYDKSPETYLHVIQSELSSGYTPNPSLYQLALENNANSGMVFIAGASNYSSISFADTAGERGLIFYNHDGDYLQINTNGGATLKLDSLHDIYAENSLYIKEQAAANADAAGYGQYWIRNNNPCQPWFTDDLGNSKRLIGFQDRGNLTGYDFEVGDLTTDGNWHDLDLSSIIPAGTTAVILRVSIDDDVAGRVIIFRTNGNTDATYNIHSVKNFNANQVATEDVIVTCDENRVIEYQATNTTITTLNIVVSGWWV